MLQSLDVGAWSLQVIRESLAADTLPSDSAEPSPEANAELRRDGVLSKECHGDDQLFEVCVEYCGRYNDCCYPTGLATVVKACRGIIEEDPSMHLMLLIRCITHHLCRHPKISLVRAVMGYFNVPDENTEAMEELVVTGLASACTTWKAALRLWASLIVSEQSSATVPLVAAAYVTEFGVTAGLEADDVGRLLRSAEAFRVPQTFVAQWDGSCDGDDGAVLIVDAKLVATVLQDEFKRDVRGKEDGQALEGLFGYSLSGHPIYDTGAPSTSTDGHHFLLLDARGSDCVARCESQPVVESYWIQRTIQPKRRPTLPTEDWMKELDELDDDNTTAAAESKGSSEKAAEPKVEHIRKERPVVVHRLRGKFASTIDGDADYDGSTTPEKDALLGKLSADAYSDMHIIIIGEGPAPDPRSSVMLRCLASIKHVSVLRGGWPELIAALCDLDNSEEFLNWVAFCSPYTAKTIPNRRSASQSSATSALLKPETLESLQVNWEESKKNMAKGWDAFGRSMSSAWKDLGAAAQKQKATAATAAARQRNAATAESQGLASEPTGAPPSSLNFNAVFTEQDKAAITENMNKAKNVMAGWIAKSDKFIHEQQAKLAKQQEEAKREEERKKAETAAIIAAMQGDGSSSSGGGKEVGQQRSQSKGANAAASRKANEEDVLSEDGDDNIFEIGDESSDDENDDDLLDEGSPKKDKNQSSSEQSCLRDASVMVGSLQRLQKGDVISWKDDLMLAGARKFYCQKLTHQSRLDTKNATPQPVETTEPKNWWSNAKKFASSLAAPFDPVVPVDRVIVLVLNQLLICEDLGDSTMKVKSNHRVQQLQRVSFAEDQPDRISFLYRNSPKYNTYKLLPMQGSADKSTNEQLMACLKQRLSSLNVGMRLTVTDGPPARPQVPQAEGKSDRGVDHDLLD
ncbi:hypothetical protein Pmar_PMAR005420 [Perkinsus marinus ATCC 50983]|uniref:Uncharacterized protein n=1 Tax=Perkinsus marinus (strain ATCC 50983 / TXsc) TaxID=423536 RepID=C5KBF1_PERM5|nr:hypothetical protein Pmar_PMAR005420 [Perkinsus marinus ATCC 50983]EER18477.1 hypothetical protein Pmar_PMAR005420 [Perkinsus marinus ATCC 50983]|eukprot:XP_002786681.1 hypothetical protein Pmar_PMAR005420 [Perkinsus marinus ATCC 50983]